MAGFSGRVGSYHSPHNIQVHPYTDQPDKAFSMLSVNTSPITQIQIMDPTTPITPDKVRIVCISDTHCKTNGLHLPPGDILLHAGDFTSRGKILEVVGFAKFLARQTHTHKVVIAGNHELTFGACDGYVYPMTFQRLLGQHAENNMQTEMQQHGVTHPKQLLPDDVIYLSESTATVCGLKIWGSPWTPEFHGWAYNARRGEEILKLWDLIPSDTDIVMTHGPPIGVGDRTISGTRAGCVELYNTLVHRVRPKLHVFGHIHEGYGLFRDETTLYANASTCNIRYQPVNPPICIDLDLPNGCSKADVVIGASAPQTLIEKQYPGDMSVADTTRTNMARVLSGIRSKQTK